MPKYKQYLSDGKGRDRYISIDFGGSIKTVVKPDIFERKATSSPHKPTRSLSHKDPTAVYYHSDGSGRDYYVTCDNGGLTNPVQYGGRKDIFKLSLRSHSIKQPHDNFSLRMHKYIDPRYTKNSQIGIQASQRLYQKHTKTI